MLTTLRWYFTRRNNNSLYNIDFDNTSVIWCLCACVGGLIHALLRSFFILLSVLFVFLTRALTLTCYTSLVVSNHDQSQAKIVIHRRASFVMVAKLIRFAN